MVFMTMAMTAMGQWPLDEMTWILHRDTNHIRTIRTYAVDTLTGTRQLKLTEYFDRYGYRDDSTCHNEYDDQGRLTMTESYQWVSSIVKPSGDAASHTPQMAQYSISRRRIIRGKAL